VRNPTYSTGVGLLLYARENAAPGTRSAALGGNVASALDRMKSWFRGNF
jgi:cell division protein FtsA